MEPNESLFAQILQGKIDSLSTRQLLELRQILMQLRDGIGRNAKRLCLALRSPEASDRRVDRELRKLCEALETARLLGGSRSVSERIRRIEDELRSRILASARART